MIRGAAEAVCLHASWKRSERDGQCSALSTTASEQRGMQRSGGVPVRGVCSDGRVGDVDKMNVGAMFGVGFNVRCVIRVRATIS